MNVEQMIPQNANLEHWLGRVTTSGSSTIAVPRKQAIQIALSQGMVGAFCRSDDAPEWVRKIAEYNRAQMKDSIRCQFKAVDAIAAPARGQGRGKRAVNFQYAMGLDPRILSGAQNYNNCSAWCVREIVGCSIATDKASGKAIEYKARPGTAVPYGSRNYRGDNGMDPYVAALACHNIGVQLEISYPNYDLSTEENDEAYGVRFGGGIPTVIREAIANDKLEQVSEVDADLDLAMDLLYAGHFVGTGSTTTAGSDGDPVSRPGPVGPHAQANIGYDDTDEFREWYQQTTEKRITDPVFIFDQSWPANWIRVTNWPEHLWGPRPEGAFVLPASAAMRMYSGGAVAVNGIQGFQLKKLPDMGWRDWL